MSSSTAATSLARFFIDVHEGSKDVADLLGRRACPSRGCACSSAAAGVVPACAPAWRRTPHGRPCARVRSVTWSRVIRKRRSRATGCLRGDRPRDERGDCPLDLVEADVAEDDRQRGIRVVRLERRDGGEDLRGHQAAHAQHVVLDLALLAVEHLARVSLRVADGSVDGRSIQDGVDLPVDQLDRGGGHLVARRLGGAVRAVEVFLLLHRRGPFLRIRLSRSARKRNPLSGVRGDW